MVDPTFSYKTNFLVSMSSMVVASLQKKKARHLNGEDSFMAPFSMRRQGTKLSKSKKTKHFSFHSNGSCDLI